jgi:hypothetical protein
MEHGDGLHCRGVARFRHVRLDGRAEKISPSAKNLLPPCAGNAMPAFPGSAGTGSSGRAVPLPSGDGSAADGTHVRRACQDGWLAEGCSRMVAVAGGHRPCVSRRQWCGRGGGPKAVRDRDAGRGRGRQDASPMYGAEVTAKPRHGPETSCVCPVPAMIGDAWRYSHHHDVKTCRCFGEWIRILISGISYGTV